MNNLYERLVDLIGKTYDDPVCMQLLDALEATTVDRKIGDLHVIFAWKNGLTIKGWNSSRRLWGITFHLRTAMVESGEILPYQGNFPNNILATDSRGQVRAKMRKIPKEWRSPGRPPRPDSLVDDYDEYPDLKLSFTFDSATGQMVMISVSPLHLDGMKT